MDPTDTHFYDGTLPRVVQRCGLAGELARAASVPRADKARTFAALQQRVACGGASPAAVKCLRDVCDTHARYGRVADGGNTNWDDRNGLHACDLLYLVSERASASDDALALLCAQLHDMRTGMCPQGRTTRLLQVLFACVSGDAPKQCESTQ